MSNGKADCMAGGKAGRLARGLALAAALLPAAARADEWDWQKDAPGRVAGVKVEKGNVGLHRLSRAEGERYNASLLRLRDLLLARQALQGLRGVELRGYTRARDGAGKAGEPVPGFGRLLYHPLLRDPRTGKVRVFGFPTWEVAYDVNEPCASLEPVWRRIDGRRVYAEPPRRGEVDGLPVYALRSGSELLVFTRSGRPPWVPVTREDYARERLAYWEAEGAQFAPAMAMLKPRIDRMKAALAAMPPAEKGMQARDQISPDGSGLDMAPPGSDQGTPLVQPDPAWYDPALPRSAFQVLIIRFDHGGDVDARRPEATRNPAPLRVWETLHRSRWADLAGALTAE